MKKFLKIFLIVLMSMFILLLIASISLFLFLKNVDIKAFKPKIIETAQQALGRDVDFQDISLNVSFKDGAQLRIKNFTIAEDPTFGNGTFANVETIDASLDILSFLKFKTLSIPGIIIHQPRIQLIQNIDGQFNIQSLGSKQTPTTFPNSGSALPALLIKSFQIHNGNITFKDMSDPDQQTLSAHDIDFQVQNFSLHNPFDIKLDAAILQDNQNFHIDSKAKLLLDKSSVALKNVRMRFDADQFPIQTLNSLKTFRATTLPKSLKGQWDVGAEQLTISDRGISDDPINLSWSDGAIDFPNAAPGVSVQASRIQLDIQNLVASLSEPFKIKMSAAVFQDAPNIDFNGTIQMNLLTQDISLNNGSFSTDLALWPMKNLPGFIEALRAVPLPEKANGALTILIDHANITPKGIKDILVTHVSLKNGSLTNFHPTPEITITAPILNITVNDFSLDKPFKMTANIGLFNDKPNVSLEGQFTQKDNLIYGEKIQTTINFDLLSLENIRISGLIPKEIPLPQQLKGLLAAQINPLKLSDKGIDDILASIEWQNGSLVFQDATGMTINAPRINLTANDVSLKTPFTFNGSVGYESPTENISFRGTATLNPQTYAATLTETTVTVNLDALPLDNIQSHIPALATVPWPETIGGTLNVNINRLASDAKGLPSILADLIWQKGHLTIKDLQPGVNISASAIDATVKRFSLSEPFEFDVKTGVFKTQPNLFVKGTAKVDPANTSVNLKTTNFQTDLSLWDWEELRKNMVSLKGIVFPETLKGQVNIDINQAFADAKGLQTLEAAGSLKNGFVKTKDIPVPLENITADFQATAKDITISDLNLNAAQGHVKTSGVIRNYLTKPVFETQNTLSNFDLTKFIDQKDSPVKIEGLVSGDITVSGDPANISSFKGNGAINVSDGKLKDLNVLKTFLDKLSFLPNASAKIQAGLPERYKNKLTQKDTLLTKTSFKLMMDGGKILINPTSIEADEFLFSGQTLAGLDQSYEIKGTFSIHPELSAAMIKSVPDLQYIADLQSNISFPVSVKGKGAQPPQFDNNAVMADVGKNILLNIAQQQLLKSLGGTSEQTQEQTAPDGTTQMPSQQMNADPNQTQTQKPSEQMLDSLLDSLFNP